MKIDRPNNIIRRGLLVASTSDQTRTINVRASAALLALLRPGGTGSLPRTSQ